MSVHQITCKDVPQRWYQKSILPAFTVSCHPHAWDEPTTLRVSVVSDSKETMHLFIAVPIKESSVEIKDKFRFRELTRQHRNVFKFQWYLRNQLVAEGTSQPFQIMSQRLKKTDSVLPSVEKPTLDTLLINLPGVGSGYARRFAMANMHTIRDLAETSLTDSAIFHRYFCMTEEQVIDHLLIRSLEKHQVTNARAVVEEIQKNLMFNHQHHAQLTIHNNFSQRTLSKWMAMAKELLVEESSSSNSSSPEAKRRRRRISPMSISFLLCDEEHSFNNKQEIA
jgi:hypothetical protein